MFTNYANSLLFSARIIQEFQSQSIPSSLANDFVSSTPSLEKRTPLIPASSRDLNNLFPSCFLWCFTPTIPRKIWFLVELTYFSCNPTMMQRLDRTDTSGGIFLQQPRDQICCGFTEFQECRDGVFSFTGKVSNRFLVLRIERRSSNEPAEESEISGIKQRWGKMDKKSNYIHEEKNTS